MPTGQYGNQSARFDFTLERVKRQIDGDAFAGEDGFAAGSDIARKGNAAAYERNAFGAVGEVLRDRIMSTRAYDDVVADEIGRIFWRAVCGKVIGRRKHHIADFGDRPKHKTVGARPIRKIGNVHAAVEHVFMIGIGNDLELKRRIDSAVVFNDGVGFC